MSNLASLWLGETLPWPIETGLRSFAELGQQLTLFCDTRKLQCNGDIQIEDYRNIIDETALTSLGPSPAVAADVFRLHLLKQTDLTWVDTDCISLQPLPDADWIIPRIRSILGVNNNVLRIPRTAPELGQMIEMASDIDFVPDWLPPRRQAKAKSVSGPERRKIVALRKTVFGPEMIAHFFGSEDHKQKFFDPEFFNVLGVKEGALLFRNGFDQNHFVTETTCMLHFFYSNIRNHLVARGPIDGTYIGDLAIKYGVKTG